MRGRVCDGDRTFMNLLLGQTSQGVNLVADGLVYIYATALGSILNCWKSDATSEFCLHIIALAKGNRNC